MKALRRKPAAEPKPKRERAPRAEKVAGASRFRLPSLRFGGAQSRPAGSDFVLRPYTSPTPRWVGPALLLGAGLFCILYGYFFGLFAPFRMIPFTFPILIAGGVAVWTLPETGTVPARSLSALLFVSFLAIMWPNYLAIALPGLPWITMARLTSFPLTFLLLYAVSTSKLFRAQLALPLNAAPLLWKAVVALSIYQGFSIVLSNAPSISLDRFIAFTTQWTAAFFVAAYVFTKPGRLERLIFIWWILAIILSLMGIPEFRDQSVPWAGHVPSFLAVDDPSVGRAIGAKMRSGFGKYRVQTVFASPLGLGEFLAMVTPFVLHYVGGSYSIVMRIAAAASLPLILVGILLTDTRLGFVGFLIAGILYVFCWGALNWRQHQHSLLGPAVVLSYPAVFVLFTAAVFLNQRLHTMTLGGGQQGASTEARKVQLAMAIPKVLTHPLGFGLSRGGQGLGYVNAGGVLTVDSYFLATALDLGIVGFGLFIGLFAVAIWNGFFAFVGGVKEREQTLLIPLTLSLIVYLVIKTIYSGVDSMPIAYMMFGAIAALIYRLRVEQGRMPPLPTGLVSKRRA